MKRKPIDSTGYGFSRIGSRDIWTTRQSYTSLTEVWRQIHKLGIYDVEIVRLIDNKTIWRRTWTYRGTCVLTAQTVRG